MPKLFLNTKITIGDEAPLTMLSVIDFLVGVVPEELAYHPADQCDLDNARQVGPGMAAKIAEREGRTLRTLTWPTLEAAEAALAAWKAKQ